MRITALAIAGILAWIACTPSLVEPTTSPAPATSGTSGPTAVERPTAPPNEMKWSRVADIPTPRSEVAAVLFRDQIYVIGGFGGQRTVERYDPKTDRWEGQPDLPIGVDHPMAAAVDGKRPGIFVIGGNSGGSATSRVFHLAPEASSWREVAPMPGPRSAGAAIAILDPAVDETERIVVVGGASSGVLARDTLLYDPDLDTWTTGAPIPTPRDHLAAALMSNKACAVGGRTLSMSRNLAALECYDPATDTWERRAAAPTARGGVGAAMGGKYLYFIGGEQPQGTFKEVEIYDPFNDSWSAGPDLPTPRHGMGVVAIAGRVFVLTGGPTPGGSQTAVNEVLEIYDESD